MAVLGIDHVQISIPAGRLDQALPSYVDVLGSERVPNLAGFISHGGAWLQQGAVQLHPGEEAECATDGCARPALRVDDLDTVLDRASRAGHRTRVDEGPDGFRRASVFAAFGNRIELMQAITR